MLGITAGCKEETESPEPQTPASSEPRDASQDAPKPVTVPPKSTVDIKKDDPDTPSWLPRPADIVGWNRQNNTRVLDHNEWSRIEDVDLRANVQSFRTTHVTLMQYKSDIPNPTGIMADVRIITTAASEDAYGLFRARYAGPSDLGVGTLAAFDSTESSFHRGCWQGQCVFEVSVAGLADDKTRAAVDKLMAGLVRPVPSADPPTILTFFPTAHRIPDRVWLARETLTVLPKTVQKQVLRGGAMPTSKALGLGEDTLAAVVTYLPGENEKPNYIWLVRYPSALAATEAYTRYKSMLTKINPVPDVMLELPRGRFLCGTWTREQESIPTMQILAQLAESLPDM
jgi:hypothetical protein